MRTVLENYRLLVRAGFRELERIFGAGKVEPASSSSACSPTPAWSSTASIRG
jgi:hypothetical protein